MPTGIRQPDSVSVPASTAYAHPGPFQWLFMGTNYRQVWATPVRMPVFRIKEEMGGLTITKLGGGQQTKSLRMVDKKGKEWVLRTIDKNVDKAMPPFLRNTIAHTAVQDMVSAAHPYAPLTVAHIARVLNIHAPDPRLFFVPAENGFGEHSMLFANKVCFLEQISPTHDGKQAEDMEDVLSELAADNSCTVVQQDVLKARLLDMLINDWDRHGGQWRWGHKDANGHKDFYPVPVDRDQAFFNSNGWLIKFAAFLGMPHMKPFKPNMRGLRQLNFKSRSFDGYFLNDLSREEWEQTLKEVQQTLTDDVLAEAVKKMPPEAYAVSGEEITKTLIARKNDLLKKGMKYYEYMAQEVTIIGTAGKEYFRLRNEDKDIVVAVYNCSTRNAGCKLYERVFHPSETSRINIVGISANDVLEDERSGKAPIKVNLITGEDTSKYDLRRRMLTRLQVAEQRK